MLDEKWCRQKPFAIRCSLIDIVSARPIDRCTLQQQQQLAKLLQSHKTFYASVNRSGTISSDVFLYYVADDQFHCVNEIFPSRLSSTDDEEEDEVDEVEDATDDTILSRARMNGADADSKGAAANVPSEDADAVMRSAGSTFIVNEQSANEVSMLDANQNEVKTDNTSNDMEMKERSDRTVPKEPNGTNQQRLSKPEDAIVQHIDETGAIFVNIKKRNKALKALRFEIQKHMLNAENGVHSDHELAWNVNDYCLVFGKFDGFTEWVRGKIVSISTAAAATVAAKDDGRLAQVYLRDVGKTVEIPLRDLRPSTDSMRIVQDFAWKSRLAFIEIKQRGGQTSWIVKVLEKILKAYDELAISVVGSSGNHLNIILWGIVRDVRAMLPEKIELTNINEELVKHGYAVALTEFDGINDVIGNLMNTTPDTPYYDSDNFQPDSPQQMDYAVTEQQMEVNEWLPPDPVLREFAQREFAAYPMHVSHNLELSILDANQRTVADEIAAILERKHRANELVSRDATEWKKEDPCFVRFIVDGRFYRGSVRRVNLQKNNCRVSTLLTMLNPIEIIHFFLLSTHSQVRFIDYGNCETCSLDDLRKATMFGNIPVQTRLYQLDNVHPFTENGKWPKEVQVYCSEAVVDRHCNVIVTDEAATTKSASKAILCKLEIFTKDIDLASALVARKMAKWIR